MKLVWDEPGPSEGYATSRCVDLDDVAVQLETPTGKVISITLTRLIQLILRESPSALAELKRIQRCGE